MTDPSSAKKVVVLSMVGTGIITVGSKLSQGKAPPLTIGVGVFVGAVVLAGMAEFAPELAGPLAVLVLIGAIFTEGQPFANTLASSFHNSPPRPGSVSVVGTRPQ